MSPTRQREKPDATPPFLTKDLIDGWIVMAEARMKHEIDALKLDVKDQLHQFDKGQLHLISKVEKLAGDGEKDEGAVGRLEKLVTDYIRENREASTRASTERQQMTKDVAGVINRIDDLESAEKRNKPRLEQIDKWKLIPVFTKNIWKILTAIIGLTLAVYALWGKIHP